MNKIFYKKSNIKLKENKLNLITYMFKKLRLPFVSFLISVVLALPIGFINLFLLQIILFLCSTKFFAMSCLALNDTIKLNKKNPIEKEDIFFDEEINKDEQKIESLKASENSIEITESKVMIKNETRKKLELIKNYIDNREEHIYCYNNGLFNKLIKLYNYNENELELIKLLIEEDLDYVQIQINEEKRQKVKNRILKK